MLRSLQAFVKRHALVRPGDRVGVAASGGADSVALLRVLLEAREELGIVLSVVHFNHKLRGEESDGDEEFVAELAKKFDLPLHRAEADTRGFMREKELSLEAAARELRYAFFGKLIKAGTLDKVATAHTLDDQAETVLLRIFRGTGTSGLAGILPRLKVGDGAIVRPILGTRRIEVIDYLKGLEQNWREDSSNSETIFTRNRLRHEFLPAIAKSFNPEIVEALSNLAEIARSEDEYWAAETAEAFVGCHRQGALQITELLRQPKALQRRVLRLAAAQAGAALDFSHGERILGLLQGRSREERTVELANGFRAVIAEDQLRFSTAQPQAKQCGYSYTLSIPGEVDIRALRLQVRAVLNPQAANSDGYNGDRRIALGRIGKELVVRNWRSGDRFWPAHTRSEKKVKELLQERHLPAREKSLWPVALAGDKIVWMRGFPVATAFAAGDDEAAVVIEETSP